MAELTERQQEIQGLLEQGMKAPQIAKKLKISPNGVYQHLRRMRENGHGTGTATRAKSGNGRRAKSGNGRRKGGRKPGRQSAGTPAPTPTPAPQADFTVTPLQAVRVRRDSINAAIKAGDSEVAAANRALIQAVEARDKLAKRHGDELKQLEAAETALTANRKPRAARSQAGKGSSARKRGGGKSGARSASQKAGDKASPNGASGSGERHLEPVS